MNRTKLFRVPPGMLTSTPLLGYCPVVISVPFIVRVKRSEREFTLSWKHRDGVSSCSDVVDTKLLYSIFNLRWQQKSPGLFLPSCCQLKV
jgi:hypothetical protein